jgi:hypothetical protein
MAFCYEIDSQNQKIALILAGNIPVGFHDFLSVQLQEISSGKTSSNDQHLLPFAKYIIADELSLSINHFCGKLENFDAVIATGSNNTTRYFEYYFKDKPIIEKAETQLLY